MTINLDTQILCWHWCTTLELSIENSCMHTIILIVHLSYLLYNIKMNYKYRFQNDYTEGAHPNILEALTKTNLQQDEGYGNDSFCEEARKLVKAQIQNPQADVHFTSGGTQANIISLASMLKPYESVIAPFTSHISEHEAGAIEAKAARLRDVRGRKASWLAGAGRECACAVRAGRSARAARVVDGVVPGNFAGCARLA